MLHNLLVHPVVLAQCRDEPLVPLPEHRLIPVDPPQVGDHFVIHDACGEPVTSSVSPASGRNGHADEPQVFLLKHGTCGPKHLPPNLGQLLDVLVPLGNDRIVLHVLLDLVLTSDGFHHLL